MSETPRRYGISDIVLRHVASLFSVVPSPPVYNDIYLTRNYASELHGKVANEWGERERERERESRERCNGEVKMLGLS